MHCMLVATFFDFGSNLISNLEMTEKRIQERKKIYKTVKITLFNQ